jgi:glutamate mutase epsilon subunit
MITITTILMYIIIGVFVRRKRRNTNSVIKQYALLCRASKMIKISKDEKETYESFGKKLVMAEITSINVIEKINHIVEKEKYSSRCVDDEEIAFVKENVANIMNEIYSRLNVLRKFIYRYVKWL